MLAVKGHQTIHNVSDVLTGVVACTILSERNSIPMVKVPFELGLPRRGLRKVEIWTSYWLLLALEGGELLAAGGWN